MNIQSVTYVDTKIQESRNEILNLNNFYDTILIQNIDRPNHIFRAPIADFFLRYRQELSECIIDYFVPLESYYKPKTISLEVYDTTEMWLSILRLNNMRNITEFNQPLIQVYNPHDVKQLINIFFKREGVIV